jgi:hypothetical protein
MKRTVRDWRRLGAEAAGEDRGNGNSGLISDSDLESALAGHCAADLGDPDICEDPAVALAALVHGYLRGE